MTLSTKQSRRLQKDGILDKRKASSTKGRHKLRKDGIICEQITSSILSPMGFEVPRELPIDHLLNLPRQSTTQKTTDLSKGVPRSSGGNSPTAPVVRVRPHQVAHRPLMGHLIDRCMSQRVDGTFVATTEKGKGARSCVVIAGRGNSGFRHVTFDAM